MSHTTIYIPGLAFRLRKTGLTFAILLTGFACGPQTHPCTAGMTAACVCSTGAAGMETCQANGSYSACVCTGLSTTPPPAGTLPPTTGGCSATTGLGCTCDATSGAGCPIAGESCLHFNNPPSGYFCSHGCGSDPECAFEGPGMGMCLNFGGAEAGCVVACGQTQPPCPAGFGQSSLSLAAGGSVCVCVPP